jgi:hypothetical protein
MAFVAEHGETDVFSCPKLYHEKLLAESEKRLAQAARVVPADSVEAKRIAFVAAGLTSTPMQIKNIDLMGRYWKTRDEGRVPEVISQWAAIEHHVAKHPFAIHWGPLRQGTKRMAGLHPKDPGALPRSPPPTIWIGEAGW